MLEEQVLQGFYPACSTSEEKRLREPSYMESSSRHTLFSWGRKGDVGGKSAVGDRVNGMLQSPP